MKNDNLTKKGNNDLSKFWFALLVVFLIFIYFIPKEIAYPKYKSLDWVVFVLIFMAFPYLVFKIIKSTKQNTSLNKTFGICALSILIVGPTFGVFQKYREEKVLKLNGKVTECFVVDRKKSKNNWLINCKYFIKNVEFTTYYHTDVKNKYQIGDTIKLIYNKEFPRMYKIDFK